MKVKMDRLFLLRSAAFLILLALAASSVKAAVLTDSIVKDTAKEYSIFSSESVTTIQYAGSTDAPKLLTVNDMQYWVAFFYPSSGQSSAYDSSYNKIVIADTESIDVIRDSDILGKIYKADYEYAWERNVVLGKYSLTYSEIDGGITDAEATIKYNQKAIDTVRDQALKRTSSSTLEAHFTELDDLSMQMIEILDDLRGQEISNGKSEQASFSDSGDTQSYEDSIANYNATFTKMATFADKADEFFAKITASSDRAELTSDEKQVLSNINQKGLGTEKLVSADQLRNQIIPQYNAMVADEPIAVNNSIKNTIFRIAKAETTKAYNNEISQRVNVNNVLDDAKANPALYSACNLDSDIKDLTATWASVTSVMGRTASADEYNAAKAKIATAASRRDSIYKAREACLRGPTPTPKPEDTGGLSTIDIVIAVVVIAIGIWGVTQYQKMQAQKKADEEEA